MGEAGVLDPALYSDLSLLPLDLGLEDLDADLEGEFSLDDLLRLPEGQDFLSLDAPPWVTDLKDEGSPGVCSSSSPLPSGHHSPDLSSNAAPTSPASSDNCSASGVTLPEVMSEEPSSGSGLKRKKGDDDGDGDGDADADPSANLRGGKLGRSSEEGGNPMGMEEENKRRARLMRNRESAQLSRQRKKHYVDELEEKVRAMHSTINELNSRISFVMAENATLRHKLSANSNGTSPSPPPPPGVYPPPPMHFPWIPYPGYAMRPNGTQVPLVPIPKLKTQQLAPVRKAKKSESKKADNKTKKVASISLLGLLFILLVFGVSSNYGGEGNSMSGGSRGRVLSVSGRSNGLNGTDEIGLCSGKTGFGNGVFDLVTGKRCQTGPSPSPGSDGFTLNSSEPLPALLYVPRDGRHVKINGNLIIHSVLASEKAMAHASSRAQNGDKKQTSGKDVIETGLAIHGNVTSALAVHKAGRGLERHVNTKRSSDEDTHGRTFKSPHADGPLQQWFLEGLAGPILSSGMCTEVFQFDVSRASADPSSIIPVSSIINSTAVNSTSDKLSHPVKMKNRRILDPRPIPLTGSTHNGTDHFEKPSSESGSFQGNKAASSMVVSVLADPREAGDGDGEGMMSSPKSLSRIFVVVLVDSVKYVTYSCVLPLKSSSPHLVS